LLDVGELRGPELAVDIGHALEAEQLEVEAIAIDGLLRLQAGREDLEAVLERASHRPDAGRIHREAAHRIRGRVREAIHTGLTGGAGPGELGEHAGQLGVGRRRLEEVIRAQLEHIGEVSQLPAEAAVEDDRNIVSAAAGRIHERGRIGIAEADQHGGRRWRGADAAAELAFAHRRDDVSQVLDPGDEGPALGAVADDEDLRAHGGRSVPQAGSRPRDPDHAEKIRPAVNATPGGHSR
jgi:hypothetical protein